MKSIAFVALAAAVALPVAGASAQSITSIAAEWDNAVPASNTTINNSDPSAIKVCWPTGGDGTCASLEEPGTSGYLFERATTPISPAFDPFVLGTFSHYNFPVSLDAPGPLTSVDLLLSFNISGATPSAFSDSWTLTHEETRNSGTCAYPGGSPCADLVSFALTSGALPTPFEFDGSFYTLTIIGFGDTAEEAALNPDFITTEGNINTTQLWAEIQAVPTDVVPEPATMTLLATGLAGLAAARRKKHAKNV